MTMRGADLKEGDEFTFEIWQGGIAVVIVTASDLKSGFREIAHYARQYEQEGPIEIRGFRTDALGEE